MNGREEPVLLDAVLAELLETVGDDPEFLDELVTDFLADATVRLAEMAEALDRQDVDALIHPSHTLKGAAASLGGRQLETVCRGIESLARSGELDALVPLVELVAPDLARLQLALDAARDRRWQAPARR